MISLAIISLGSWALLFTFAMVLFKEDDIRRVLFLFGCFFLLLLGIFGTLIPTQTITINPKITTTTVTITPAHSYMTYNVPSYCIYDMNQLNIHNTTSQNSGGKTIVNYTYITGASTHDDAPATNDISFPANTPDWLEEANELIQCPPVNETTFFPEVNVTTITNTTSTNTIVQENALTNPVVTLYSMLFILLEIWDVVLMLYSFRAFLRSRWNKKHFGVSKSTPTGIRE